VATDQVKLDSREIKVIVDRETEGIWRVEYFDDDGACYVGIFSEPHCIA
jgi:hypothetical protein